MEANASLFFVREEKKLIRLLSYFSPLFDCRAANNHPFLCFVTVSAQAVSAEQGSSDRTRVAQVFLSTVSEFVCARSLKNLTTFDWNSAWP